MGSNNHDVRCVGLRSPIKDARRISGNNCKILNGAGDHRGRSNDAMFPHVKHDHGAISDPRVLTNCDAGILPRLLANGR